MNTTSYRTQSLYKLKPLRMPSDDLPSFEEAFNQDYLRQFFRTTGENSPSHMNSSEKVTRPEETNIMSFNFSYSPYKDQSMDDTGYSVADTNDTYISPQKDAVPTDKTQLVNHLMQLAADPNMKHNLETTRLDSYTQGIYAALNGVDFNNNPHSSPYNTGYLQTVHGVESLSTIAPEKKEKKKVFLIIRNAIPSPTPQLSAKKPSDKSSGSNVEKTSRRGKGQRKLKDRLKSADNIIVDFSTANNESAKRRASFAANDYQIIKKVKVQNDKKDDFEGAFEFDLDPDRDFKPGYFDILPSVSFDEIINREYPVFNGNALETFPKF